MRILNYRAIGISRRFLMAASAYRRFACHQPGADFSPASLVAQYAHETYGYPKPDERHNGYTLGKKWLGVTLQGLAQDLADGLMSKSELRQGSCAFVRHFIRSCASAEFFPWRHQ